MTTLIKIVEQMEGEAFDHRELRDNRLFAVRLKGNPKQFMLIKAQRCPGKFTLSHFTDPIGVQTLNRYISANLS